MIGRWTDRQRDGLVVKKLKGDTSGTGIQVTTSTLSKPVISPSFAEQYIGGGKHLGKRRRERR